MVYGSNNLGKSVQTGLLAEYLRGRGLEVAQLKYPIYDSETGRIIDDALRHRIKYSDLPDEYLQWLFAENRRWYEPQLIQTLESGCWVVAEDYTGTGKAWGLTKGVKREHLERVNQGLMEPDWAVLLDAPKRFGNGIERGHRHEDAGDELWLRNRGIHLELAAEYGWEVIADADRSVGVVHQEIVDRLEMSGLLYGVVCH